MKNRFSLLLANELRGLLPGEAVVVDWSSTTTQSALKLSAQRAARRVGLVVALDPVFDGLKVTVVDRVGEAGELLA